MSTVEVSNIHLESTGNNRIQVAGSNVSIFQAGELMMTANSSEMTLVRNDANISIVSYATDPRVSIDRVGDILTRYSAYAGDIPAGYVRTDRLLSQATYPTLFSTAGSNNITVERWFDVVSANFTNQQYGIAYGNGVFVSVGASGSIQTSTNGTTWTNRTTANTQTQNAVAYGNGVFVSVGGVGSIQSSTDGTTWTNRTTANNNGQNSVAYGNGVFVSVGGVGSIQTSTNGTTWTNRTTANTQAQRGVAYGNGVFVSVGDLGSIQSSTDGTTWTNRTTANTQAQTGVAYGNGVFVAIGTSGAIQTSTNGTTWTNRTGANTINTDQKGIAYGNGVFVSVSSKRYIQSSTDGITWTTRLNLPDYPFNTDTLNAVGYGDGVFVAGGPQGFFIKTLEPTTEFTVVSAYVPSTNENPIAKQYVRAI